MQYWDQKAASDHDIDKLQRVGGFYTYGNIHAIVC